MGAYLLRRLLLIPPTLFVILLINFIAIQFVPGGPIEQILSRVQDAPSVSATARVTGEGSEVSGSGGGGNGGGPVGNYRGAQGLPADYIAELERQFGFDKPVHERFLAMLWDYVRFDFGESYFRDEPVVGLVLEKMPVSISLGLWTTLITYLISIPMGIAKAVRDGSPFDVWSSSVVIVGNAIPAFLFAILLLVVFASGQFVDWFPLRGIVSDNWEELGPIDKVLDYLWHMALPILALSIGSFATLTMLTKNSFMDEINKQYVVTARSKGLTERQVLYGHVFRNGMLLIIAGFPSAFIGILFTGSLLIELIFSLDGLGLLGFEAALNRDYAVMLGTLYFFTLLGLLMGIVGDFMYHVVDPRIDFESREV